MTTSYIISIGLSAGLIACGLFIAWILRNELRKALNVVVLSIGVALLVYGYSQSAARHESPQVKEVMFMRHLIAGWALVGMGVIGLQCGGGPADKDKPK